MTQWIIILMFVAIAVLAGFNIIYKGTETKVQTISWFEKKPEEVRWAWKGVTLHIKRNIVTKFDLLLPDSEPPIIRDAWGKQVELKEKK